jgi:hypothetical protein
MSAIGFDSCFYERLNHYSKSLNRILLASEGKISEARDEDWSHTLQLVKSLSVASCPVQSSRRRATHARDA